MLDWHTHILTSVGCVVRWDKQIAHKCTSKWHLFLQCRQLICVLCRYRSERAKLAHFLLPILKLVQAYIHIHISTGFLCYDGCHLKKFAYNPRQRLHYHSKMDFLSEYCCWQTTLSGTCRQVMPWTLQPQLFWRS